jgi:hypothetical protein
LKKLSIFVKVFVMNSWVLVYCFSKELSLDDIHFEQMLEFLKKSIEFNSRFHTTKIYTDNITYEFIKNINTDIIIINYTKFKFLDDIKIQTLPILTENEILIDIDIFLYKSLIIDTTYDLILEHRDSIFSNWYVTDYMDSNPFKFSKHIHLNSKSGSVGNIGIIKFLNKSFLDKYVEKYNKITDIAKEEGDKLPSFPKFSILFGQLLLQNLIDEMDYQIYYTNDNKNNKYVHLAGENKKLFNKIKLHRELI